MTSTSHIIGMKNFMNSPITKVGDIIDAIGSTQMPKMHKLYFTLKR